MKYTMYYEECNNVSLERYHQLKSSLTAEQRGKNFEEFGLRKLQFIGASDQRGIPGYYLCVKNQQDSQIYLEKKYMQDGIHYKKCAKVTREEYERIMKADIGWMRNHKKGLFADFYLQATLNSLSPGYLTDYKKEMLKCRKEGYVTFYKGIQRAVGVSHGLFDRPDMVISCLNEKEVLVTYKKVITLPVMISNMLQGQEEPSEDLAFVF